MRWLNRKNIKKAILFVVVLFIVVFSAPIAAFAEDGPSTLRSLDITYYDAEQYALSKTYLYAIKDCYTDTDGKDVVVGEIETDKTKIWDTKDGEQAQGFLSKAINYSTEGTNSAWLMSTFEITDSEKISCKELGGYKVNKNSFIPGDVLGVTADDIICGVDGDVGLYKSTYDYEDRCADAQFLTLRSFEERDASLKNLFDKKINKENISESQFEELSQAELYYAYKNSLINDKKNCGIYYQVSNNKPSGNVGVDYFEIVTGFDVNTGSAKISYVTAKSDKNIFYGQEEPTGIIYTEVSNDPSNITCGELIRNLGPSQLTADGDNPVKSAQNLYLARAVENCNSRYGEQLAALKAKLDNATQIYESAKNEESEYYDSDEISELEAEVNELQTKYDEALAEEQPWILSDGATRSVQCVADLTTTAYVVDEDSGKVADSCYENAGPLGWVVCPVISTLLDVLDKAYGWVEDNYLRINVHAIFGKDADGKQSSIYVAWSSIRNVANLIFIGLLLVVIYSQITGLGIDNYGIKKILPKMVVMAILINLSYIICQISVELSNILGVGIRNIFNSSAVGETAYTGTFVIAMTGAEIMTASAVVASFMVSPGLVIVALFALLSAVISVVTLLVILVFREVGVVLLTVVSPVAFAFAMMPNTEKIFNKYINIAKGLLFLYPLCSLVIGAGHFAGVALSNMGEQADMWRLSMAALLAEVVPYLFIPSLLKSSLNSVNGLGDKVQNIGRGFNSRTVGRMKESGAVRNLKARMNAGVDREGNPTRLGRIRAATIGQTKTGRRSMARSITMAKQERTENLRSLTKLDDAMNPNMRLGKYSRADDINGVWSNKDSLMGQLSTAIESGDTEAVESLTNRAITQYGSGAVSAIGDMIATKSEMPRNQDENSGFVKSMRKYSEMMKDNREFSGAMTKKAGDVAEYLSNGGYGEVDGREQRVGVRYFTENSNVVSSAADYATQSTATLRRFAAVSNSDSGKGLTQEMAQIIRNSDDDSIKSGMMSESGKKDIIDYVANTGNPIDADWSSADLHSQIRNTREQNNTAHATSITQSQGEDINNVSTLSDARVVDDDSGVVTAEQGIDGQGILTIQGTSSSPGISVVENIVSDSNNGDSKNANIEPVNNHHFSDRTEQKTSNDSSSNESSHLASMGSIGTSVSGINRDSQEIDNSDMNQEQSIDIPEDAQPRTVIEETPNDQQIERAISDNISNNAQRMDAAQPDTQPVVVTQADNDNVQPAIISQTEKHEVKPTVAAQVDNNETQPAVIAKVDSEQSEHTNRRMNQKKNHGNNSFERSQPISSSYRPSINYKSFNLDKSSDYKSERSDMYGKWNPATHRFTSTDSLSHRPLNEQEASRRQRENEQSNKRDPMDA